MKVFTTLFIITFSFSCAYSQIDWESYEEPDGTFKRLSIDPSFSFDTDYDGQFTDLDIDLNSGVFFRSLKIDTFSVLNIFSNSRVAFGISKQNNNDARRFAAVQPSINISYDKYLKKRRGMFLSGRFSTRLGIDLRTNATSQYNDFTTLGVGIGTGRIENVSTLYQATRINKQLKPESPLSQDQLFTLADRIRTLDYNMTLDSRMERIQNQTNYLNTMKSLGYSLESFNEIANAIDAFNFERPNFVGSGSRFVFEASTIRSFDNDLSNYSLTINHTFQKPINERWHWSNNFVTNYDISNKFISASNLTRVNYFPNGRTQISFQQSINYTDGFESFFESTLNYFLGADVNYFVSPTLSVFGTFAYDFNNIGKSNRYNNDLSNSIGFRKFLI